MPRIAYDDLVIIPSVVAKVVTETPYTGEEISIQLRSAAQVETTERLRQAMTPKQKEAFIKYADDWCRAAYNKSADWFMKIVRSRTNRGRDQLYFFIMHWLSAFLDRESKGLEHPA